MKKRLLAILLVIALAVSLLPVGAMADNWSYYDHGNGTDNGDEYDASPIDNPTVTNSEDGIEGIEITKTLTETDDGGYEISLEAYVTGTISAPEARPLDIVLVLDQSGSMGDDFGNTTRQAAMKQAVNNFITSVERNSGEKHRIAIVTFGSDASQREDWTYVNAQGADELTDSIDRLPRNPEGATNVAAGMTRAATLMNSARDNAEKVVIVFTDGVPTESSEFDTDVANKAIKTALSLKKTASVYTIGIFGGANPDQLYGASGFDTNSNGTVGSKWVVDEWGFFPGWDFPEADVPAANRFLNYLSSNYSTADVIGLNRHTSGWGIIHSKVTYTITENATRTASDYYLTASDADGLNKVFQVIAGEIVPGITAGANSVLTDTLTEYVDFDLPAGAESVASWKVMEAYGGDTEPDWTEDTDYTGVDVKITGKTITATGFDYSADGNVVTRGDNGWQGHKLVVTFPIEINEGCTTWDQSGYYPTNETSDTPAGVKVGNDYIGQLTDSPEIYVKTYKVDYKFVSGTEDKTLPQAVTNKLDTDKPDQEYFLYTTPAENKLEDKDYDAVHTADGTWTPGTEWETTTDETTGDVTYTLTWTYTAAEPDLNGDPITIQVYVDEVAVKTRMIT